MNIVVVGSLNMDLVVRTPRHPEIGETIIGTQFQTFPGGKGANQAVAAARLGGSVKMVGRVGSDGFGESLLRTVASDGVDTRFIRRDPEAATGVALITVDEAGKNTIVVASGANARLTPQDVSEAEELFKEAAVLVLQLESPLPAVTRAIELAHQYGARIVLNPAPAQKLENKFLRSVDYLIPNQTELFLLTGINSVQESIAYLHNIGVAHLIVTLGEDGSLVAEHGQITQLGAFPVQAVDTTAAGDAFVGAFAVALTEGLDTQLASIWGNAAGALAVTRPGAQPSLPSRDEFDLFLSRSR